MLANHAMIEAFSARIARERADVDRPMTCRPHGLSVNGEPDPGGNRGDEAH